MSTEILLLATLNEEVARELVMKHRDKLPLTISSWNSGSADDLRIPDAPTELDVIRLRSGAGKPLVRIALADLSEFTNLLGTMSTTSRYGTNSLHSVHHAFPGVPHGRNIVHGNTNLGQNKSMATDANIHLPDDLFSQVQTIAERQGRTADDLMVQAAKREVARQLIHDFQRERKPSGLTEEEEMEVVNQAVHEYRRGR